MKRCIFRRYIFSQIQCKLCRKSFKQTDGRVDGPINKQIETSRQADKYTDKQTD